MGNKAQSEMRATEVMLPGQNLLDPDLLAKLRQVRTFQTLRQQDVESLRGAERVTLETAGTPLRIEPLAFWALLDGEIAVSKLENSEKLHLATFHAGETFGEVLLLFGRMAPQPSVTATKPSVLIRFPESTFWQMLANLPAVRDAVRADFARRYESYQAMTLHREKLISLGTLAAGLMHELNNPGAAASRAAAQLRGNMLRLQEISLRMTRTALDAQQLACLAELQEQAFTTHGPPNISSLEQSDREEALSAWLEGRGVENAWHLAPVLIGAGWQQHDIECASSSFSVATFSDALNYLAALISSMQQVGTVEESIARVVDLVSAVKKYAYDDKYRHKAIDLRDSLLSTLTILGHKFRQKGIHIERNLPPERVLISCRGIGLAQVWTNLLDNAIDAAPENGSVGVRLWTEAREVCVGIRDNGPGIPPEHRDHIFEAFYTTKDVGVGTGLGLDIVQRIVVDKFHGRLSVTSVPGATEFIVRLPLADGADTRDEGCCVAQG